jgi:SAM-dependent methyltransferase
LYDNVVKGDITKTPFEAASFDCIWCISSLEHFGMDNSGYTANFSREDAMDARAVHEMLRILAPGGQLLITVPYGKFENHGTHKNMDRENWQPLIQIGKGAADVREWYFHHTFGAGWQEKPAEELRYVGYYDQANAGAGGLAVALMTKR